MLSFRYYLRIGLILGTALLALFLYPLQSFAAASEEYVSTPVDARLVTAQNGVVSGAQTISGGLLLNLNDGWKTYWKSPGEVGIPPEIQWGGSENIADIRLLWPAPHRFRAFGIENFGYAKQVLFPLEIVLQKPGEPAVLSIDVSLLVCSELCVPENFTLTLALGSDISTDADSAELIAKYANLVPVDGSASDITLSSAFLNNERTTLTLDFFSEQPFNNPDVFPDMGLKTSFGTPDIRLGRDGRQVWARLPILSSRGTPEPLNVTLTDGTRAAEFLPTFAASPATAPFEALANTTSLIDLSWIVLIAILGGFILNAMPCVLPVLSIKFSSALKMRDQSLGRVRVGFLASAAGVLTFIWLLAGFAILARLSGVSVGWGLQFQNPQYLIVLLGIILLFAANMFGLFEINLPQSWSTRLQATGKGNGLVGDFSTGIFSAAMATPCSAPFLGTAVAFALAGRPIDIFVIFTALGVGLAIPYLIFAANPRWIRSLPKPGRWMVGLKWFLGALLLLTAAWLIWVLSGVGGFMSSLVATILLAMAILLISLPLQRLKSIKAGGVLLLSLLALASPFALTSEPQPTPEAQSDVIEWIAFSRPQIARLISEGQVVFVDVTADWCLTCKANKALVIDRGHVAEMLGLEGIVPMQADWTRQDENIRRFLEDNGRYGIPFNIVYGPAAPEGIVLSEVLSTDEVVTALEKAGAIVTASEIKPASATGH